MDLKSKADSYDKDKIAATNCHLRKWINKLLRFNKRSKQGVQIDEFKTIVESIKELQQTFDYMYLPKYYEYFDFIEELRSKLQRAIVTAQVEKLKIVGPQFEESYIEKMKEVLYDISE